MKRWTLGALTVVLRPWKKKQALVVLRDGKSVLSIIPRGTYHANEDPIRQDVRDAVKALWDELEDAGFRSEGHPAPHAVFLACPTCGAPEWVWCWRLRDHEPMVTHHKERWL